VNNISEEKRKKRNEVLTVGTVSIAHFFSHFFILCIPSVLPLIRTEFGVTNLTIGFVIMAYSICAATWQYPMGVCTDKFGSSQFMIGGLIVVSLGVISMGFAPSVWFLVAIAAVNGTADSIFHPADYTVITAKVRPSWLGRSYAIHTFTGFLGFAVAPVAMAILLSYWDWRTAISLVGLAGLVFAVVMFLVRPLLQGEDYAPMGKKDASPGVFKFLTSPPLLIMFAFYVAATLSGNGIQNFGNAALMDIFNIELVIANSALAAYLWGIVFGVLVGGFVADRMDRFDVIASGGYIVAAALLVLIALGAMPFLPVAIALFFTGFMIGVVMPARDVMVKSITPPGSIGKAFGFVSSGFGVGGTIGPLIFASLLDWGMPAAIFLGSAAMMLVTIILALTASSVGRRALQAQPAE